MTDITKCPGRGCPARERCYRYTAPPDEEFQGWSYFDRYRPADSERCRHYVKREAEHEPD